MYEQPSEGEDEISPIVHRKGSGDWAIPGQKEGNEDALLIYSGELCYYPAPYMEDDHRHGGGKPKTTVAIRFRCRIPKIKLLKLLVCISFQL